MNSRIYQAIYHHGKYTIFKFCHNATHTLRGGQVLEQRHNKLVILVYNQYQR